MRKFIRQHFSDAAGDRVSSDVARCTKQTSWRYCVLYVYGGVYADIKTVFNKPLDEIFPTKEGYHWYAVTKAISNVIIMEYCNSSKNPFIKRLIDHCVENV